MRILLWMPHRNSYMPVVTSELLVNMSLIAFKMWHKIDIKPICWAMVNVARNAYLEMAYKWEYDYLFWLDDDNPTEVWALMKLMAAKKDIIGAIVPQRRKDKDWNHSLNAFTISRQIWDLIEYEKLKKIPLGPIIEVDAIATSCLLMNKHAIQVMFDRFWWKPFEHRVEWYTEAGGLVNVDNLNEDFDGELISNHVWWDMIFCRRAKASGLKIFAETTIKSIHLIEDNFVSSDDFKE